jgi:purine-binding chemotaxis protein CheW
MDTSEHPSAAMLLVRVADRFCALPIHQVCEVMRPLPIHHLDQAPACVAGLAVVRGRSVPVIELFRLLSSSASAAEIRRFVTILVDQRQVALAVSAVEGVRDIDHATLSALPPLLDSGQEEVISALGVRDRQLLLVLNAARLLPEGVVTGTVAGTPP